jgi:serine protease Do
MKRSIFLITVFVFMFAFAYLYADTGDITRVYPVPVIETEEILSRWLYEGGFKVSKTSIDTHQFELTGQKGNESWMLVLKPHSPLASYVTAQYTRNGEPDQGRLKEIWTYIGGYLEGRYSDRKNLNQDVPQVILSQSEAIVCIKATTTKEPIQFSGFLINNKGFIISTAHDLERVFDIMVILNDGQELKGYVVKLDSDRDLALIGTKPGVNTYVSLDKGRDRLKNREKVYSYGCPANHYGIINSGTIDGPQRRVNGLPIWQVNMEVLPGSSGSPVFDAQGNLAGVVKGRYRGIEGKGFFIPLRTVRDFLNKR